MASAKQIVKDMVEEIDQKVAELDKRLVKYDRIKEQRDKLMAARRALLGGSTLTGAGGTRIRITDIKEFLVKHPGSPPSVIAEHFRVPVTRINSHLYRGKDEMFLNKDGKWWARNPKKGLNTEDDIEEE